MAARKRFDLSQKKLRSALTNGTAVLADVDHRSAWMRRLKDLVGMHVSDLGGADAISHSEMVLVRRASMLTLQLEMMERQFAAKDGVASDRQLDVYQRAIGSVRRIFETLGLQRRSRDVTPPSLDQYLRQRAARMREESEDAEMEDA